MSVSSVLKGVVAQVNPLDHGATYGTYNKPVTPTSTSTTAPGYGTSTYTNPDLAKANADAAAATANYNAIKAQLAVQPRLPIYNTSQAWATAQKQAESHQNPVYQDKLNAYLQKAAVARQQTEAQTATNKQGIQTDLSQNLEDIGTQRTRVGEDTATNLADLNASQAFDQQQGGTQFDRMRSALLGDVANSGLTTSGLGAQQEDNAITDRNATEAEQGRQYTGKKDAANLNLKRTNQDLDVNTTRSQGSAVARTAQEDTNLKNFIDNASLDEQSERASNEAERLSAISGDTGNYYKTGVADFIQSLIGSGARAQDIQLAQQVYG